MKKKGLILIGLLVYCLLISNLNVAAFNPDSVYKEILEDRRIINASSSELSQSILDYQKGGISEKKLFDLAKSIMLNKRFPGLVMDEGKRIAQIYQALDESFTYQNKDLLLDANAVRYQAQYLVYAASAATKIANSTPTEAKLYVEIANLYLHLVTVYDSLALYD